MTETAHTSSTPLALVLALAVGALGALVVVTLAFSVHNTKASVEGNTATTSHWVE